MNFEEKRKVSFTTGVVIALFDKGLKKEAGLAKSVLRRGTTTTRRGPAPINRPQNIIDGMGGGGASFKNPFWRDGKATPLTSGAATVGTLGGMAAGGTGLYNMGHGYGQIDGAKETMNTAVDAIDGMDNMRKLEFFLALAQASGKPEMVEHFKQLIPEDKRQYFA